MNEKNQVDLVRATEELLESIRHNDIQSGNGKSATETTNKVEIHIPDFLKNRK